MSDAGAGATSGAGTSTGTTGATSTGVSVGVIGVTTVASGVVVGATCGVVVSLVVEVGDIMEGVVVSLVVAWITEAVKSIEGTPPVDVAVLVETETLVEAVMLASATGIVVVETIEATENKTTRLAFNVPSNSLPCKPILSPSLRSEIEIATDLLF